MSDTGKGAEGRAVSLGTLGSCRVALSKLLNLSEPQVLTCEPSPL